MKQLKIGELNISIISGQIMSRVTVSDKKPEESIGKYKVVIPKCINSDGTLSINEMAEEKLRLPPDEKRVTKCGDIVMKLSTPYSAAKITEESSGCLVPSFCAIIKVDDECIMPEILSDYLLAYLNSEKCKSQLKAQVAGSVMTVLSVGKIKEVMIPVPSLGRQQQIADEFIESQRKLQVIREIMALTEKRNDVVFNNLVKEND